MRTISTNEINKIELPEHLSHCPVCKDGKVVIDDIDDFIIDDDGGMIAEHISINCDTEPGDFSLDWEDWHSWHWAMPYVDWLPLHEKIKEWLVENYRFVDGEEEKCKLAEWNKIAQAMIDERTIKQQEQHG